MHPAPNLLEAPPRPDNSPGNSPPVRKDTISSISTQATTLSAVSSSLSVLSTDTANTVYGPDAPGPTGMPSPSSNPGTPPGQSPPNLHQSIFSVKDGSDLAGSRKPSRRRTGPLSASQREKAALIRKLGACGECRRRRVACNPAHHGMTWEDAQRKYRRSNSPSIPDIMPMGGRPLSPAQPQLAHVLNGGPGMGHHNPLRPLLHDTADLMDLDQPIIGTSPHGPPGRPPVSEARLRTPLPSAPTDLVPRPPGMQQPGVPRPLVLADKQMALPGIESLKTDLQSTVDRILANRSRYIMVQVLLLHWQDDDEVEAVEAATAELAEVLHRQYRYSCDVHRIPSQLEGSMTPWKWLQKIIMASEEGFERRDVLKIVYYNGHSHLDANREMVLASSKDKERASTIRWSGIQQSLEENVADTLIIMDAAYYPSSPIASKIGVLEVVAASTSEDHFHDLGRCTFTRALTDHLHTRATRDKPATAAELHSMLLSSYPKLIQDRNPERETITSFPSPLHMQTSKNSRLPSILLAPVHGYHHPQGSPTLRNGNGHLNGHVNGNGLSVGSPNDQVLHLDITIPENALDYDNWVEWLRMMPEGVRDVKVGGYYPAYH